jgi:hypothetical protein
MFFEVTQDECVDRVPHGPDKRALTVSVFGHRLGSQPSKGPKRRSLVRRVPVGVGWLGAVCGSERAYEKNGYKERFSWHAWTSSGEEHLNAAMIPSFKVR